MPLGYSPPPYHTTLIHHLSAPSWISSLYDAQLLPKLAWRLSRVCGGVVMLGLTSGGGFLDSHGGGQGQELAPSYTTNLGDIWLKMVAKT